MLLTSPQRGAVASIAVVGAAAPEIVAAEFQSASQPPRSWQTQRLMFGTWRASGEEIVVCPWSEQEVEIHCHGGRLAAQAILERLAQVGCRLETDNRENGIAHDPTDQSPIQHEVRLAMSAATTLRAAAILLDQHQGAWTREVGGCLSLLQAGAWPALRGRLAAWQEFIRLGQHLVQPFQVVLGGRPNAGKSSLVNALLGFQRSIVHDRPGTTRDVVTGLTAIDGWPVQLADMAGLRASDDALEAAGVERARRQISAADLVLLVIDGADVDTGRTGMNHEQRWLSVRQELTDESCLADDATVLVVVNKSDLLPPIDLPSPDWQLVSAQTGAGLPQLLAAVAGQLVPQVPSPGAAIPFSLRHRVLLQELSLAVAQESVGETSRILAELAR